MADRYWVGGAGTWDATTTTNWSATSGGAGGASAPTSSDNVIFDANSNTLLLPFTVTVTGTSVAPAACLDFSTGGAGGALDGAMTLTMGATAVLDCYGSMALPASNFVFSITAGAIIAFKATTTGKTITPNGVSFGALVIQLNGVGGEWTLGGAVTGSSSFNTISGTFNTGNFSITASGLSSTGSAIRSIVLGSSTITLSAAAAINITQAANITFNAGTSTINCSGASSTLNPATGLTFYNVSFTSNAGGATTINGANTFNNLNQTSRNAVAIRNVILGDSQTVSGTLTLGAANAVNQRLFVQSSVIGTQRTITLNGTLATLADVDFRDIATAGTVGTWTGTRLGNCLNNSGITFDAAKTVYWNLAGTQNWSSTGWATTNNGTPAVNNFPLAQDTAVFTEAGAAGTVTINTAWNIGSIQMADGASNRTTAFTLATSGNLPIIYGNVTLFSSLTTTGTQFVTFAGQGTTQTITSAGVSFTQPITVNSPNGTVQLLANLTCTNAATNAFVLTAGTLDLNEFNLSVAGRFTSSTTNVRSIDFGSAGKFLLTNAAGGAGLTNFSMNDLTNFSYAGTSRIELSGNNTAGVRIVGIGSSTSGTEATAMNVFVSAGSDNVEITSSARCINVDFTGFSGSFTSTVLFIYGNLVFSSGMTVLSSGATLNFIAPSGTQQLTTNGKTIDKPILVGAVGSTNTLQLQDNLTMGSTRTFTLTAGTLNLNSKTLTAGSVSTSNSNTRSINFGVNGVINCEGAFTATTSTGLTTAGRGRIKMSSASTKTFAGGGANYAGVALEQAGAGTLTITGANTFDDITNSNATASQITFPASTITLVRKLSVSGSSGNLVSLRSSTDGTKFTIQTV